SGSKVWRAGPWALLHQIQALFDALQPLLYRRDIDVIVLLYRHDAGEMLPDRNHLDRHRLHSVGHLGHIDTYGAKMLQEQVLRFLGHYPTLPSRLMPISFWVSAMNSIGSCCNTSRTKPFTI